MKLRGKRYSWAEDSLYWACQALYAWISPVSPMFSVKVRFLWVTSALRLYNWTRSHQYESCHLSHRQPCNLWNGDPACKSNCWVNTLEYCLDRQLARWSNSLDVRLVHQGLSTPRWLYMRPAESNACFTRIIWINVSRWSFINAQSIREKRYGRKLRNWWTMA